MGKEILVMFRVAYIINKIQARYALQCCVDCKEKELEENHRECNYANKSARLQGKESVGAFSGRTGLPPAVTGWAASYGDGP